MPTGLIVAGDLAVERCTYQCPDQETRVELTVVNSRFIATAAPAFSVDEAREFIARIKREFSDATHNVSAYLIGHGATVIAHCSDDGEPAGTAGRPVLAVLQGSGMGDVAVVVTRYFGGTKLGTGGLVRAYGEATRLVLAALPRAVKIVAHKVAIVLPYSYYERIHLLIAAHRGAIVREDFAAEVRVIAHLPAEQFSAFQSALRETSSTAVSVEIIEPNTTTLVPVTGK